MPPKAAPAKKATPKGAAKPSAKPAAKPAAKPSGKGAAAKGKATTSGKAVAVAAAAPAPIPEPMGETVGLKQFQKFCFDDPDSALKKSGRWPMISDETERAATFLRYRDVNMISVLSAADMDPDRIRLALIGGLRFGKPIVFDFTNTDVSAFWPKVIDLLNAIKPNLLTNILDKTILNEDVYMDLVKESDGDQYDKYAFNPEIAKTFAFVLSSATAVFPPDVVQKFFVVTIE